MSLIPPLSKGKKKDQAMGEYIALVNDLYQQYR